jgi:hypothetical protein
MPFKSDKQRKWMHANEPDMAKKWEKEEALREKIRGIVKGKLEATTTSVVSPHNTPTAFKKSTQIAIDIDDEDDEKNESTKEYGKTLDKIAKDRQLKSISKKDRDILIKIAKLMKRANESMAAPFRLRKSRGLGRPMKVGLNEYKKFRGKMTYGDAKPQKGDYVKTIAGIAQIEKIRGSIAFMKLPGKKTKGYWMNDLKNLKPTDEKEKGKTLWTESVNESRYNVKKAIKIAKKMGGNMTGAVKKIEKIQKGLSKQIEVEDALRKANESVNESDLGLTYKKGKTVKVTHKKSGKELIIIDKPNVKKEYEKIGYFTEGQVNELSMAPFSSQEARAHINSDIKDMSKHLGKASQQVIKIMMDGVRKGKYTAMDISRGVKEGPAARTHFGEMTFIQSLWTKMREKFRRYSKDRKLS